MRPIVIQLNLGRRGAQDVKPVVVIVASDPAEPVRGLLNGVSGRVVEISLLRPAGRCLLAQHSILTGKSLSIRIVSEHWQETPPLQCFVVGADEKGDQLRLKVELLDWRELAKYWGHELHWLQQPSDSSH